MPDHLKHCPRLFGIWSNVPVGKLVRVEWGSLSFSHGIFGGFLRLLAH